MSCKSKSQMLDIDLNFNELNEEEENLNSLKEEKSSAETSSIGLIRSIPFKRRFLVRSGEQMLPVQENDIAYPHSEGRWCYLNAINNKQYHLEQNLTELETQMNPRLFFKLSRNYLTSYNSIHFLLQYLSG